MNIKKNNNKWLNYNSSFTNFDENELKQLIHRVSIVFHERMTKWAVSFVQDKFNSLRIIGFSVCRRIVDRDQSSESLRPVVTLPPFRLPFFLFIFFLFRTHQRCSLFITVELCPHIAHRTRPPVRVRDLFANSGSAVQPCIPNRLFHPSRFPVAQHT